MKQVWMLLLSMMSIQCCAMQDGIEKKFYLNQLLSADGIKRTVVIGQIMSRSKSTVLWSQVGSKIYAYLKHIDLFVNLSLHPALLILKKRAIESRTLSYDGLQIKQDLFVSCWKDNVGIDPNYQIWQTIQDQAAHEVRGAKKGLWKVLQKLEFEEN